MGYRNGNHYVLNVSSLPNTLNNRINIQITMGDQHQFAVKQIVWAKVSDYPWWPARIVKTLAQRSRKIYRVHFFGDPTYCYLQSQQLLDFDSGLPSLGEGNSNTLILKKSIQLAKAAYKKNKIQQLLPSQDYQCSPGIQLSTGDFFEETKLQSKPIIENMEKMEQLEKNETPNTLQKTEIVNCFQNICTDNVIQHITGDHFRSLKASKGYNNKKQVLNLEIELKQILLAKYHLWHLPKTHLPQPNQPNHLRIHRKSHTLKRKPIKKAHPKQDYLTQSSKKLHKILLKHRNIFPTITPLSTTKIIETIHEHSQSNHKKYASLYMKVIGWIRQISESVESGINLHIDPETYLIKKINNSYFDHYHAVMDEQLKKEDEEKSKVTQIEAGYV